MCHQVRICRTWVLPQGITERRRHGPAGFPVGTGSVSGTILVFATTEHLHIRAGVKRICLFSPIVPFVDKGQVHAGAAVTTIHNGRQSHAFRQRLDNHVIDLIIGDLPGILEIHRQQRLMHSILFKTIRIFLLRPMARKREEQSVAGLGIIHKPTKSTLDVRPGGRSVAMHVVGECQHAIMVPTVCPRQERLQIPHIINATSELGARAEIVDADEEGSAAVRPMWPADFGRILCDRGPGQRREVGAHGNACWSASETHHRIGPRRTVPMLLRRNSLCRPGMDPPFTCESSQCDGSVGGLAHAIFIRV
mmetsp:Transcript_42400/g.123186  ORF Transcript_42400/g.123186 Transcript_42400/m.123186 type:complete len:307 (+) Transcript_42400:388-1308(+)